MSSTIIGTMVIINSIKNNKSLKKEIKIKKEEKRHNYISHFNMKRNNDNIYIISN